ncbi:hypothetical protein [Trichodesmium erythraeum]|uniref:hypothetical protein n=1 Tax=Trichodesmium erythraeum TaxID=1206 RepID=UPI00351B961C
MPWRLVSINSAIALFNVFKTKSQKTGLTNYIGELLRKSFQKIYLRYQTLHSVCHTKNYSIF